MLKNKSEQTSFKSQKQSRIINKKIILVGSPNTGKSLLFNALTGAYTTVSNYPGTTVEVSRGKTLIGNEVFEILDTPGMYSLNPITEEEEISRQIIMKKEYSVLIHVVDAKNIDRMLPFTLHLIESKLPVILVLNMMDEANKKGISVNSEILEDYLGIPVVKTVAVSGEGVTNLKNKITYLCNDKKNLKDKIFFNYNINIEYSISEIASLIDDNVLSKRTLAILLLQGDQKIKNLIEPMLEKNVVKSINSIIQKTTDFFDDPLRYVMAIEEQNSINTIISNAVTVISNKNSISFSDRISRVMTRPLTGIPVLLLVTYFGLYQLVGVFGAGIVVDFIEKNVFDNYLSPFVISATNAYVPWVPIQNLLVGDYGVFTLGLRYAIAIILPIVGIFFFAFAIIEDTGYLPRMALLIDRVFKKIGLSGRAVIPMTLGFGCGTMATMVTRTLETKRERIIATMLLALAIPCSAQLGVIVGILSGNGIVTFIWASVIIAIFLLIGLLTSIIMPGEKASFYMELPPLRLPKISNILNKTYTRMEWYFIEILPLFLAASVIIWIGQETGIFQIIIGGLVPVVNSLGLPDEVAVAFLFGFFRRDFGAAGLYDLHQSGLLSPLNLVVSTVTITLFIPCIAQFSIMLKERGLKTALGIALFIFPFAFFIGYLLNSVLGGFI